MLHFNFIDEFLDRILTVCLTFVKRNRTPVKELVDEVKVQNQADLSTLLYH